MHVCSVLANIFGALGGCFMMELLHGFRWSSKRVAGDSQRGSTEVRILSDVPPARMWLRAVVIAEKLFAELMLLDAV
jgi:hypothetical protein